MKNLTYFLAAAGAVLLYSCGQPKQTKVDLGGFKPGKYAFKATFEKDGASMDLDINQYGGVTGKLYINIDGTDSLGNSKGPNIGELVQGTFRGDTLFADYNFKSGKKTFVYTNPVALLHKGDTLIMGSGKIMSYLGRNYLDPKTGIDFVKSRFRFVPVK